jgi:lipoprotein-anchoring transpeptidase ErfK/SrfK
MRELKTSLAVGLVVCALAVSTMEPAQAAPETVAFDGAYKAGSIVIVNAERKLYYVLGDGKALRYGVAVGNPDEIWTGKQVVTDKKENPRWVSPDGDDEAEPGPDNPLGVRALYLGWTLWRIHGTPKVNSIGRAVSNGCIRMLNEDVTDLYERVHIGAPVYAIKTQADAPPIRWGRKISDDG